MNERNLDWEEWFALDQEQWWAQHKQEEEARRQLELPLEDTRADIFLA